VRRETQNILLVLLGGALLKISFTGVYLRYVKPSHQWLLIAAGFVMVLLALVSIGRDLLNPQDAPSHHHSAGSTWLLLLPVLAIFLIGPPALGSDSVQRAAVTNRSAAPSDGMQHFPPLAAGEVSLPLSEFATRAAWDSGNSLDDRPVDLTGFIVHDGSATYLARLAIGCCAADAFPVKVRFEDSPEVTALPNDTWVVVTTIVKPGTASTANDYVPSASAAAVRRIPQPEDPYEH
jgi:uncharacterized repeat protein (TIGR03943 family)